MQHLYPFQERVLKEIAEGKNVILVIPTGGGKTRAALLPFLQSIGFGDHLLPGKALYAVPMRSLATQFLTTCRQIKEQELNADLFHEIEARYRRFGRKDLFSIQTGETPEDPQFEAMVTACTIDQLLASGLGVPYSLDSRRTNINVGAICGSYLILDEPHLYPLSDGGKSYKGALTTCLELLRLQHGLTRFVFMSATMSRKLVDRLCQMLDAVLVTVDEQEMVNLAKGRVRTWERSVQAMCADAILRTHQHCSLVVCNTVQRAQTTYLELEEAIQSSGRSIELRLLHSRFSDQDRQDQGKELPQLLGKEQWQQGSYQGKQDVIVVATQVVEVGLDISVETLHTEIAPVNSLIQRAGRCARFEQQRGRVIIYPIPLDDTGQPGSYRPYETRTCEATWQALKQFEGQIIGFREEQTLIDQVHTEDDLDLLARYEAHRDELQQDITKSLRTNQRGDAAELIRDVTQVQLLIHNQPDETITTEPWRWQRFSFHPNQLQGRHWQRLKARQDELGLEWMCKQAHLTTESQDEENQRKDVDSRQSATYQWDPVTGPDAVPDTLMLAMPNQLVTYDQKLGLVFLDGRLALPASWKERLSRQNYQSSRSERRPSFNTGEPTRMQSYEQHIGGLADAYYGAISHELAYTMRHLEHLMGLEAGCIDQAIQLAIATHDLGKLDEQWQRWARAWQHHLIAKTLEQKQWIAGYREPARGQFLAKTDYDFRSKEQREWQKELTEKRPPHACESVMVARSLLIDSLNIRGTNSANMPVLRAICYAIAHHHTTSAHEYGKTKISPDALEAIEAAFQTAQRGQNLQYDITRLNRTFEKGDLFPVNNSTGKYTHVEVSKDGAVLQETWLAFLLLRALRLADQRADTYVTHNK